jgi:hypothetical protein
MWVPGWVCVPGLTTAGPNCASSDCAYVFLRDARDVAKADTWGSSDRAASVRRFACLACGHSWMREEG